MAEKATKKELIRQFSAGGAVFKKVKEREGKRVEVLWLIVNPKGTDRWQLPKGEIEKSESSIKTARREVNEEGGIDVQVLEKIGEQRYFFYWEGKRRLKTVIYYLMQWRKDKRQGFDKQEIGKVKFVPYEQALMKLTFKNDQDILTKASVLLNSGIQESLV